MAAKGSETPDLTQLKQGTKRVDVERILGKPIKYNRGSNGDVATYQFFSADDPSYKRAATYAVLDGLTLGVAEVFTSPVEMVQGDRHEIIVTYSRFGRLKSYRHLLYQAPLPPPEKIIERGNNAEQ